MRRRLPQANDMDSVTLLPTAAALFGSLTGGVATLAGSWISQHRHLRAQARMQDLSTREVLYSEFIIEASRRLADAWNHEAEGPEVVANLFAALQRMRLNSSPEVVDAAKEVIRHVIDAYAAPGRTFQEARERIHKNDLPDLLSDFSDCCRRELDHIQRS
jgi:hypothetical protein